MITSASLAEPDSPTTSNPSSESKRSFKPRRTTSWSSKRNTRMTLIGLSPHDADPRDNLKQ